MKNVILITIDTLRRDVFGCYGNRPTLTPFMDSIQEKCLRFEKAYATGPYTQASFPGILTSTYYLEYGRQMMLPAGKTLISEAVKKEGVITAAFHSNPYLSEDFGWNRGWDIFYDSIDDDVPDLYPFIRGKQINKKVETWLSGNIRDDMDRSFFLWVHYMDVHEPYVPEEEFINVVDADLKLGKEEMFGLFREVILKRDISDKENVGLLKKLYSAKVLEVDSCLRELFHIFDMAGVLDKSVIFFASDHGDEGDHGAHQHHGVDGHDRGGIERQAAAEPHEGRVAQRQKEEEADHHRGELQDADLDVGDDQFGPGHDQADRGHGQQADEHGSERDASHALRVPGGMGRRRQRASGAGRVGWWAGLVRGA